MRYVTGGRDRAFDRGGIGGGGAIGGGRRPKRGVREQVQGASREIRSRERRRVFLCPIQKAPKLVRGGISRTRRLNAEEIGEVREYQHDAKRRVQGLVSRIATRKGEGKQPSPLDRPLAATLALR